MIESRNKVWSVLETLPGWKVSIDKDYHQKIWLLREGEFIWARNKSPRNPQEAIRALLNLRI